MPNIKFDIVFDFAKSIKDINFLISYFNELKKRTGRVISTLLGERKLTEEVRRIIKEGFKFYSIRTGTYRMNEIIKGFRVKDITEGKIRKFVVFNELIDRGKKFIFRTSQHPSGQGSNKTHSVSAETIINVLNYGRKSYNIPLSADKSHSILAWKGGIKNMFPTMFYNLRKANKLISVKRSNSFLYSKGSRVYDDVRKYLNSYIENVQNEIAKE